MGRVKSFAGIAVLASLLAPGSAGAAITFGSNLATAPNGHQCNLNSCTQSVASLPANHTAPGGVTAPINGVIVRWRIAKASGPAFDAKLRVIRDDTTGDGTGPLQAVPSPVGVHELSARLPIQAGEYLGVDLPVTPVADVNAAPVSGAAAGFWGGGLPLQDGETRPIPPQSTVELLMNADVEPDADKDGYGDETQDGCPTRADTQGPCPPGSAGGSGSGEVATPQTTITSAPKGTIHRHRARFGFSSDVPGSSFECALDHEGFKPCHSPKTVAGLARGRHRFQVRAISASGVLDSTPAVARFRVAP